MSEPEASDLSAVETALGHGFADPDLLKRALVHGSATDDDRKNNETLEFLGDAVIHLTISERLMADHPDYDEGQLSRARAALVSTRALALVAQRLNLGAHVRLGKGEEVSGGRSKPRLLASSYEAVIGAMFLDVGYPVSRDAVLRHFDALLAHERSDDDYKTRLQEVTQSRYRTTPAYRTVAVSGPEHARRYHAEVEVGGAVVGTGEGSSRKSAEQLAASEALARLERRSE